MGMPPHLEAAPAKNIVELAAATSELSTLVTALKAGKLVGALSGAGPFTVFAPTNEAFAKLPKSALDHLLDPKNFKELDALLEYHVISGAAVHKADLKSHQKVKTLEGQDVKIKKTESGEVKVNHAKVLTADVDAANGVVHIIDAVLMPPHLEAAPAKNVVELAAATPELSTLVTALKAGKLTDALSGQGPFTVFAPSNEAFAKLPKSILDRLLDPKNIKELQDVLEYHVIAGAAVHKADLKSIQRVKTLEGKELAIFRDYRGNVRVGDARVTTADVDASNGVVHIIDHVLLPLVAAAPVAKNIVELAAGTPDLSTLVTALKAGKLTDALSGKGPFTVFAPSNEAFAKLPKSVLDRLLDPKNIKELQDVLE